MVHLKNRYGFSLVELMTVMTIVGIMGAIALPSYISQMPQRRLKAATRDLYGAMQQTRVLAIRNNRSVILRLGADSYYIDEDDSDTYSSDERRVDLSEYHDVRFSSSATAGTPGGWAVNNGGSIPSQLTFTPAGTITFDANGFNSVYFENINGSSETFAVIAMASGAIKINWNYGDGWE